MEPEEDQPKRSARLQQSLDRAYDPDAAEDVDNRMVAMLLQLSSDEESRPAAQGALARPGLAVRLLRSLRRR